MRIVVLFIVLFCRCGNATGQNERVHLDLDRYTLKVGDTINFKGYIFKGMWPSKFSTTLYIELCTSEGIGLAKASVPIFSGIAAGQIQIPSTLPTDNYYLLAYTRALTSTGFPYFTVPVVAYNPAAPRQIFRKVATKMPLRMARGIVKGINWQSVVQNGKLLSQLEVDSGTAERRLVLVLPEGRDSAFQAERVLSRKSHSRLAVFPVDRNQDAYTLYLYEDSVLIGRQYLRNRPHIRRIKMHLDTLSGQPGANNEWIAILPDSGIYSVSIAVTDADHSIPSRRSINDLTASHTDDFSWQPIDADTNFLTFPGMITDLSGNPLPSVKVPEIIAMAVKDTIALFTKSVSVDSSGQFSIDSILMFGDNILDLQAANEYRDDYKLVLRTKRWPKVQVSPTALESSWGDDSLVISGIDTAMSSLELKDWELQHPKWLAPLFASRKENVPIKVDTLNEIYTSAMFSQATGEMFDPRSDSTALSLDYFLRGHVPEILFDSNDRPIFQGKGVLFYCDEQPAKWEKVSAPGYLRNISFIKVFKNQEWRGSKTSAVQMMVKGTPKTSALSTPKHTGRARSEVGDNDQMVVCLYSEEGKDRRILGGQLHQSIVGGYALFQVFQPNNVTLFWEPFASGNIIPIRFTNSKEARRFRLKIEGVTIGGDTFHYEAFIDPKHK